MSLESVADELYGLPPAEFTAARNARAKQAPEAKKLTKPSVAAWAINQFARQRGDELDAVFSLGEQLREAQDELDSATLRSLGSQRRTLITAMAQRVATLASDLGSPVGASAVLEIEQTLQAAMADPRAADALRTGRLIRSLSTDGLDEVNLEGAVAGAMPRPSAPPKAQAAERRQKQKRLADAEAAAHEAREAQTLADDRAAQASQHTTQLETEIADLTARLADARDDLATARAHLKQRAVEQRNASRAAESAAVAAREVAEQLHRDF